MKTVRTWCIRILMILFTVIFLYPLFWNLMSAFKTNAEYLTDPYALPTALNLDNFVAAWQKANIAAYFGNSIFVTVFSHCIAIASGYSHFLCTGKIPFCGQQTDLCHLYGMYFSAGYLHYDSFVSGITGCEWIK